MTPSKNHGLGFSFIEMMAALALLATFGTSLFLVQTSLLTKLSKAHTAVANMLELDQYFVKFNQDVQFALQQKKSPDSVTLQQDHKNPDYTVNIKVEKVNPASKLYSEFDNNVRFVRATINKDGKADVWWNFMYIPLKQDSSQPEVQTAKEPA